MIKNIKYLAIIVATAGMTTACGSKASSGAATVAAVMDSTAIEASSNSVIPSQQKVKLVSATHVDISQHIERCHKDKHKSQLCIRVCHKPAGKEHHYKEMVLPLKATAAHICHGSSHQMKDEDHDYLGRCHRNGDEQYDDDDDRDENGHDGHHHDGDDNDDDRDDDDDGSVPPAGGSGGTVTPPATGGGSTTPPAGGSVGVITVPPVIPAWCLPFVAIDANCDGINDSTGVSYL